MPPARSPGADLPAAGFSRAVSIWLFSGPASAGSPATRALAASSAASYCALRSACMRPSTMPLPAFSIAVRAASGVPAEIAAPASAMSSRMAVSASPIVPALG